MIYDADAAKHVLFNHYWLRKHSKKSKATKPFVTFSSICVLVYNSYKIHLKSIFTTRMCLLHLYCLLYCNDMH